MQKHFNLNLEYLSIEMIASSSVSAQVQVNHAEVKQTSMPHVILSEHMCYKFIVHACAEIWLLLVFQLCRQEYSRQHSLPLVWLHSFFYNPFEHFH
jgi:hypothetical protein